MDEQIINIGMYVAYGLLVVAVIGVIVGMVLGLMHDVKSGLFSIGAIILILIVFGIGAAMSDTPLSEKLAIGGFTKSHMNLFTGGIITFYVLFALAWAALLYDLVKNIVQGN